MIFYEISQAGDTFPQPKTAPTFGVTYNSDSDRLPFLWSHQKARN